MKALRVKASVAFSSALLLVALAGCAGTGTNSSSGDSASGSASVSASASAQDTQVATEHTEYFVKDNGDGTKVIKDDTGNEVTVPVAPQRIANVWHANSSVLLAMGGGPKLVSTTHYISTIPWFKKVYPGIADVPVSVADNNALNIEQLISDKPDVVLVSNEKQAENIRSAGLTAVMMKSTDLQSIEKGVDLTAEVIGTKDAYQRAQQYKTYFKKNVDLVKERLKDLPENEKPSVLHLGFGNRPTQASGGGSMADEWIKLAGGTNAMSDVKDSKKVTLEQIAKSQPQVIIIGGDTSAQGVQTVTTDAAWADIPAVKDRKIIRDPYGTFNWDRYCAELALQVLWSAKALHPNKFEDVDMVAETRSFYKTYFNYDLTEDEAKLILAGDPPAKN